MPQSYTILTKRQAERLLRLVALPSRMSEEDIILCKHLRDYLERFKQPRLRRENGILKLAQSLRLGDGDVEVDDNAIISEGEENGAYVMTWTWLSFEGTEFDKEKP